MTKEGVARRGALGVIVGAGVSIAGRRAFAAEPIKIGFGMQLTGPLAASGNAVLLAAQIWAEEVNKAGGLIG